MSDPPSAAGRRAAASYLHELLQRPGAYRRLWEQHVVRARPGEITQLAVAEVLARYLWSYPRVPGDADVLPHQLKDTVSRALSGRLLSRSALSLFIEAFGLSGQEADRLWRLWEGSGTISVLSGTRAVTQGQRSIARPSRPVIQFSGPTQWCVSEDLGLKRMKYLGFSLRSSNGARKARRPA